MIIISKYFLQVPQCCDTGIAIKMGQSPFTKNKCYHRGCYSCLSQQYLLGIHERCSLDQSVMKSLCSPGMSCMIYCSEKGITHHITQKKLEIENILNENFCICILTSPKPLFQSYFKGSSRNGRDPMASSILTPHKSCDLTPPLMFRTQQNWNLV